MQFVFDTLRESLFVLNQVLSLFIYDDNRTHMSARSVPSIKQLVSSANKIDVRRVDTLHKSLTYSKNSVGPRIEPCGTPHVIGKKHESVPLKHTYCFLFSK